MPHNPEYRNKRALHNRRRGAVLILILGLIFACTVMVAAFVQSSLSEIRHTGQNVGAQKLRNCAYSALDITLASMREYQLLGEPLNAPAQDWIHAVDDPSIHFPENVSVQVSIKDISGQIGIGTLTTESQWQSIFDTLGFSSFDADPLIDALLDWMDNDANRRPFGAEAEDYRMDGLNIMPANGTPLSIDELQRIKGWDAVWWEAPGELSPLAKLLKKTLTTLHTTPPNINTAPIEVLQYLCGDDYMAKSLLRERLGPDEIALTDDDVIFANAADLERNGYRLEQSVSYTGSLYSIEITTHSGAARFHLSALITTQVESDNTSSEESDNAEASTASDSQLQVLRSTEYSRFSRDPQLSIGNPTESSHF